MVCPTMGGNSSCNGRDAEKPKSTNRVKRARGSPSQHTSLAKAKRINGWSKRSLPQQSQLAFLSPRIFRPRLVHPVYLLTSLLPRQAHLLHQLCKPWMGTYRIEPEVC